MQVWGALVCGMSQAKDYKDVLVFRFFLGMIEAGFFPGVLFMMTCWYKKTEIGMFHSKDTLTDTCQLIL